jgi:hypothetical protein
VRRRATTDVRRDWSLWRVTLSVCFTVTLATPSWTPLDCARAEMVICVDTDELFLLPGRVLRGRVPSYVFHLSGVWARSTSAMRVAARFDRAARASPSSIIFQTSSGRARACVLTVCAIPDRSPESTPERSTWSSLSSEHPPGTRRYSSHPSTAGVGRWNTCTTYKQWFGVDVCVVVCDECVSHREIMCVVSPVRVFRRVFSRSEG